MSVSVSASILVPAPVERAFACVTEEGILPKVMTGYGPVPRVVGTTLREGPWDHPGANRVVHLEGGGTLHEEITDFEPPAYFAYRIGKFSFALKHFAAEGHGQWWFTPRGENTIVKWRYSFTPRSWLAAPLVFTASQVLWRAYMRQVLTSLQGMLKRSLG